MFQIFLCLVFFHLISAAWRQAVVEDVHGTEVEDASVVEEADEDRHESTEDTAEAIDKPGVPKAKGMQGQCPLFCSPGKEYANVYKHMRQKHQTTYSKATATTKRRAIESENEGKSPKYRKATPS